MAGFPRILKSPCASKEIHFPKLNLPTVYQQNRRAKLAINTQTPDHGRIYRGQVLFINIDPNGIQIADYPGCFPPPHHSPVASQIS